MTYDNLIRLADDNLNLSPGAIGAGLTVSKLTNSVDITSYRDIGSGAPLFLRLAPSRAIASSPAPTGSEVFSLTLRGTESPLLFLDGTAVTASAATDEITLNAHGLLLGTPFTLGGTAAPAGTTLGTIYYAVPTGTNTFKVATTRANALAGTIVDLTTAGTSVTFTQTATVLSELWDRFAFPTAPHVINLSTIGQFTANPSLIQPYFSNIRPIPGGFGPGSVTTGFPGIRYLTGYLSVTNGGGSTFTTTDLRFAIDVIDVVDDARKYAPSGIVPAIA